MTDKHARRVPKCLNLERTNILFISYRYHRLDLLISTMSQNECIHSSVSGGVLFRTVPGHFAERHFVERTFCRTDSMTNGLFAGRKFCPNDNLPKIEKFGEKIENGVEMASYFHIWMSPGNIHVLLDVASCYLNLSINSS